MITRIRLTSRAFAAHALLSVLLGMSSTTTFAQAAESFTAHSSTVIGANALLSDGAAALMNHDWERGIQLTQLGLASLVSKEDRAAALANLCAGHAALKQYKRALEYCDQSVAIDGDNWRTWQNRAAAHLGLGQVDESMQDIQRGLKLNPDSDSLQKTLAIARDYEKLQQERIQHLLES